MLLARIRDFIHRNDDINADWRDLEALPKEVLSKNELDGLQREVVAELDSLQKTAKPQALFYFHKYIDAKFNKSDFDVDTYYMKKQNIIDRKYAEGMGEVKGLLSEYGSMLNELKELEGRLQKKVSKLDPGSNVNGREDGLFDDFQDFMKKVDALPQELEWNKFEGEIG